MFALDTTLIAIHALDALEAFILAALFVLAFSFAWIGIKDRRQEERRSHAGQHPSNVTVIYPTPAPFDWEAEGEGA
jgi:hypothetical protein